MTTKLQELTSIPVEKRSGVTTDFYPYKIEFVLDQLNLTDHKKCKLLIN
jgi:hypothetical protein